PSRIGDGDDILADAQRELAHLPAPHVRQRRLPGETGAEELPQPVDVDHTLAGNWLLAYERRRACTASQQDRQNQCSHGRIVTSPADGGSANLVWCAVASAG